MIHKIQHFIRVLFIFSMIFIGSNLYAQEPSFLFEFGEASLPNLPEYVSNIYG